MIKEIFSRKWLWVLIIICIPVIYALFRITDAQFWDSAMGNLLATILGVIVGIPIALEINRAQQESQRIKEEEQKHKENEAIERQKKEEQEETLKTNIQNIYRELIDNQKHLKRLENALTQTESSAQDHWEWVSAISESFTSDAYYNLNRAEIDENLWRELHSHLYTAYPMTLIALRNRIREAKAAHFFYLKQKDDQNNADHELRYIRDLSRVTQVQIEQAIQEVDRFRRYKKYIE